MTKEFEPVPPEGMDLVTLTDAIIYFSDLDRCETLFRELRWPNGKPTCPKCKRCGRIGEEFGEIKTRRTLQCKACRYQFSSNKDSVCESSHIKLDRWFLAMWLIANCKNGISSYGIGRAIPTKDRNGRKIPTPQNTAWFMMHRIRAAMEVTEGDSGKWIGPVEADTTYIGGKATNMHKARRAQIIRGRGAVGKAIVHGVLERTTGKRLTRKVLTGKDDAGFMGLT